MAFEHFVEHRAKRPDVGPAIDVARRAHLLRDMYAGLPSIDQVCVKVQVGARSGAFEDPEVRAP